MVDVSPPTYPTMGACLLKHLLFSTLLLLVLAGCRTDVTVDVYSSDLKRVATGETSLMTSATMSVEIPSASECDKYSTQITNIMRGVVKDFKPQGCEQKEMNSFLLGEIQVPLLPILPVWTATEELFVVAVVAGRNGKGKHVLLALDQNKYKTLNKRMENEFAQGVNLSKSKITMILYNDERGPMKYRVGGVFVNGDPIVAGTTRSLNRRKKVRIEASNVGAAFLAKHGVLAFLGLVGGSQ